MRLKGLKKKKRPTAMQRTLLIVNRHSTVFPTPHLKKKLAYKGTLKSNRLNLIDVNINKLFTAVNNQFNVI